MQGCAGRVKASARVRSCLSGALLLGAALAPLTLAAQEASDSPREEDPGTAAESPWLLAPLFSNAPKLGTSGGFAVAYLHKFDPQSSASMFGAGAIYTSTHSVIGGAYGNAYFNADRDQLLLYVGGGRIYNDYKDFGGGGINVKTTDEIRGGHVEYLHEVLPQLYAGVQATAGNYTIWLDSIEGLPIGDGGLSAAIDLVGIGAIALFDSRDKKSTPTHGASISLRNVAFRKAMGGDADFNSYIVDARFYLPHTGIADSTGHVLALRIRSKWTRGAPVAMYSSISLHGYKSGEYLAPNVGSLEVEERYRLARRWSLTGYAGTARLYGERRPGVTDRWYPSLGIGGQYVLKESEGIVVTFEYARGIGDNSGFYVRLGQSF